MTEPHWTYNAEVCQYIISRGTTAHAYECIIIRCTAGKSSGQTVELVLLGNGYGNVNGEFLYAVAGTAEDRPKALRIVQGKSTVPGVGMGKIVEGAVWNEVQDMRAVYFNADMPAQLSAEPFGLRIFERALGAGTVKKMHFDAENAVRCK